MPTKEELKQMQACPLNIKISLTQARIREWVREYGTDGVYISFSGGKDSTVLLHIVRELYPDIEAVFVNTGLEYPELQQFVKTFDNVTILRPAMRFDEVIKKYGYPIISKEISTDIQYARKGSKWAIFKLQGKNNNGAENARKKFAKKYAPLIETDFEISSYCCAVMKKKPANDYRKKTGKKPFIATLAVESSLRENAWIKTGCNAFDAKHPKSAPMSFWTEQDVLQYIKKYNIPIAPVYGDITYTENPEQIRAEEYGLDWCGTENLKTTGCDRTGCIFCAFGCHLEKEPSRFQRLKETHPRQYAYCIGGGEYDEDGVWKPNKKGLGMGRVFDELNKIYGEGFIKY